MATKRSGKIDLVVRHERIDAREDGSVRLVVVADTHSAMHPQALGVIAKLEPDAMLHAGDIGDLRVIRELESVCPVLAVRGNIDVRLPALADALVIDVALRERVLIRILLLHYGVYGPKLRAEAAGLARAEKASLVVCGHSHVPFIGRDRGLAVFNPGSAGPRRFNLPIVFGMIELSDGGVRLKHFDCGTGEPWAPTV